MRYSSQFKKYAVLFLRSIALSALLLAFFDIKFPLNYYGVNYIVIIDNSWSMKDNIAKAVRASSNMLEKLLKTPDSAAHYISFGAKAAVEKVNMSSKSIFMRPPRALTQNNATNLQNALEFGVALADDDSDNKIILLTDGNQTAGDYKNAIGRLKGANIKVYPFHFERPSNYEVILTSLKVPAANIINQKFEGRVGVEVKNCDGLAGSQLRIYRDNKLISNSTVNLNRGHNTFKFSDSIGGEGYFRYTAFIENAADKNTHNNAMYAFCEVGGTPKILLVSSDKKAPYITALFENMKYQISVIEPSELPVNLDELMPYKLIVLNDVAFTDMKFRAVKTLKSFVSDFGGGLIMAGGDNSFGNGGYMQTPLEDLAPVTMDIKDKAKVVSCAIIFIIDKSGSMAEMSTGFESDNMLKIDLAKEAVIASIELLMPKDRVGVMAFDHSYKWVSLPVSAADKSDVIEKTAQLVADGGTSMYGALEESFNEVKKEKVTTRHLVALTDGITSQADFNALAAKFEDAKVTLSCVALGRDADVPFLNSLAQKGGGRFYYCEEAGALPSIFVQETLKSTRKLIVEEIFTPAVVNLQPVFASISADSLAGMPQLKGYVASTIKPSATLYLKAKNDDPLLAVIQCGLGKTAGFMFDLYARWSADFIKWPEFGLMLENTVKYLLKPDSSSNIICSADRDGDMLDITIKTLDSKGRYINFLESSLSYSDAANNFKTAEVVQTNAGIYSARVKLEKEGNYFFSISQKGRGGESFHSVFGYCFPYSDEYASTDSGAGVLADIARGTGGRIIDEDNFHSALSGGPNKAKTKRMAVRNYLVQLAMLLFLLEILLWRVDFSAETFVSIKKRISDIFDILIPRPAPEGEHSESVGKLLHIKDKKNKVSTFSGAPKTTDLPLQPDSVNYPAASGSKADGKLPSEGANAPDSENTSSPGTKDNNGASGAGSNDENDCSGGSFTKKLLKIKKPRN